MTVDEKARNVKLLILDVDGVLTDGKIVYTDSGEELKFFDVKDGHGMKLLMRAGIDLAIITGRFSKAVQSRAHDLGIQLVFQKALNKIEAYEEILKIKDLKDIDVSVVGDDVTDMPMMRRCGLAFAVADSVEEVIGEADYITKRPGGMGAVREICEIILKANGLWEKITARYY